MSRFLATEWLYKTVCVPRIANSLGRALRNEQLDFERSNLFAADGILFEFAVRYYRRETMLTLVEHFEKHFAKRAESNESSDGDVEEDFDDDYELISETSFAEMKENFEYVVDQFRVSITAVDEDIMAKLNAFFADPPPSQAALSTPNPVEDCSEI